VTVTKVQIRCMAISGFITSYHCAQGTVEVDRDKYGEYANEFTDQSEAMAYAYLDGGYRMNKIAKQFGVHYATG